MKIFDRQKKEFFEEKVYGDFWLRLAYENPLVRSFISSDIFQKNLSKVFGRAKRKPSSRAEVEVFIKNFSIPIADFVVPADGFKSFNDFFIRPYRAGLRPFPQAANVLGAVAEGRVSVFPIRQGRLSLSIKGEDFGLEDFLPNSVSSATFQNGYAFVFRLCPVDYHRFHFPDAGSVKKSQRVPGKLHSVHPWAQAKIPNIFSKNFRELTLFASEHFGDLVLAEVGAMNVGTIVQSYSAGAAVQRGQEKGYFEFGGSTVVMIVGDALKVNEDLLQKTREGVEVFVRLGEEVARI